MTNPLVGVRGRVTFTVLAVSAILFSLLGTIGFVQIAHSGRNAIRERVGEVLDQLETNIRSGQGTVRLSTPDGVDASVEASPAADVGSFPGEITVRRTIDLGGTSVTLVGRGSQARLTDSLRSLFRGLWIAIPGAAVITALLAGIATQRALRPVAAITDLAETIGTTMTGARVPVPATGDEIEHLARTVNEMLARIDQGRVAQRQFTSDAAHELRTPLMALQGELELVGGRPALVDAELLGRLESLSHTLGERINDLVLLSTLDEGRPLTLVAASLLELAAAEVASSFPGTMIAGSDTQTLLDRALIARAIRNLLANARRHGRSVAEASVLAEDDRVWFHVDDDGPGIDAAQADLVLTRFSRLDEARTTDHGGSGLGLAIVATVAHAHHGGVAITTSPQGGARVSFWLPVTVGS